MVHFWVPTSLAFWSDSQTKVQFPTQAFSVCLTLTKVFSVSEQEAGLCSWPCPAAGLHSARSSSDVAAALGTHWELTPEGLEGAGKALIWLWQKILAHSLSRCPLQAWRMKQMPTAVPFKLLTSPGFTWLWELPGWNYKAASFTAHQRSTAGLSCPESVGKELLWQQLLGSFDKTGEQLNMFSQISPQNLILKISF